MSMQPFTSNFADNSTEAGFQFTFYCDLCREGYKIRFIESKTHKKGKLVRGLGGIISAASHRQLPGGVRGAAGRQCPYRAAQRHESGVA